MEAAETAETVDWDAVLKRQRAIQGICDKTQPDSLEQKIQRMSHATGERVRTILKTKSHSNKTNRSSEVQASDWLDSPDMTVEARLRRLDSGHLTTPNTAAKRNDTGTLVPWKAVPQSVALFGESEETPGEDHSAFLCRLPNFQAEAPQEKFRRLISTPVFIRWPQACEKMRHSAPAQIRQLTDHLESVRNSGRNLLALCGHVPGCGCTTILLICAREFSHRGVKTLLIDGNFTHPSLATMLQLAPANGWESLLVDEENTEATLLTLGNNLDLLPLDAVSPARAKSLFRKANFSGWTDVFRKQYDLVLIDSGSLSEQEKYAQLLQFDTDGVFLIADDLDKSRHSIALLRQSLAQHEIAFLGLAENHVP